MRNPVYGFAIAATILTAATFGDVGSGRAQEASWIELTG